MVREVRLAVIADAAQRREVRFTDHALTQLLQRGLQPEALRQAVASGELVIVEDYPHDPRGASCLVLCWVGSRPVHTVLTYPPRPIVVTVYRPDTQADEWTDDYRRRAR